MDLALNNLQWLKYHYTKPNLSDMENPQSMVAFSKLLKSCAVMPIIVFSTYFSFLIEIS